jgi:hypothetical protein
MGRPCSFYGDKFHLTMQRFRCLAEYFTVTAEKLCVELMYNLDPVVNLANVKDDLGNTQSGFFFVKHPENGLVDAYLDLSTKACVPLAVTGCLGRASRTGRLSFRIVKRQKA